MECPRCHTGNREGRRFCAQCGAPLPVACAACGAANEPGERFCGNCGLALVDDPARARAHAIPERRHLTVMYCDLVGSTALSRELDPEDLRDVICGYQETTRQAVGRFGGFVARYMGDGILTYFGYPHAHEDDAARAIHAGLEIVDALEQCGAPGVPPHGVRLQVRVGIATGLVVVGDLIGEGASEEAAAVGETPNLAARLQSIAPPGAVLVAQATHDLAGGRFDYTDEGVHKLKGFDRPLHAWRVLRSSTAASRFDAARTRRLTPFVGRAEEIDLLVDKWRLAAAGQGQVVLVTGEAGIGKSRLAEMLVERIADVPHGVLRFQCSAYHTNSALHPFIQELERAAGIDRADSAERKLAKLELLLADAGAEVRQSVPLLAALLFVPAGTGEEAAQLPPVQQKQKTLAALFERLRESALRAPVLLLFEDAHWIDPTSSELLDLLVESARGLPVLAVITCRTAGTFTWLGLPHTGALALDRLSRAQSVHMVRRLPGAARLPGDVIEHIVIKTDGVPLFIEEFTKTVSTSDAVRNLDVSSRLLHSEVPSTLHDSLMARLDRLGEAKEVAQIGAVVGREFPREMVAALSTLGERELGEALDRLISSEVVSGGVQPAAFVFKHALVQDAAYASLLRSKRQDLHRRVAEIIEASQPERVRAEPEVVAHHYTQAGQVLPAAKYWAAGALRALDRAAHVEALRHSAKGLELVGALADGSDRQRLELDLLILQGAAYRAAKGFAASEVERCFDEALVLSERLDDVPRLIEVRRGLFSCFYARGALAVAREQGEHVVALGQRLGDAGAQMLGYWMLGCMSSWQGEFETARRALEDAIALYDPTAQKAKALAVQIDPGVNAMCHLSWVLWVLGYPERGVDMGDRAVRAARALGQPFALGMALFFACTTRACCGEYTAAGRLLHELFTLAGEHGLGYLESCARVLKAQELIARDQCAAAIEQVQRAFAEFRTQEAGVGLPWAMSIVASGYARLGRVEEGLATVGAAFQAMERNGEHHWEAELWRLRGELRLAQAHDEEGAACLQRAVEVARGQGARSLELRATMSLARLLDRRGETARAAQTLAQIRGWFSEGFESADLRDAATLLLGMGQGE
ncbi:MAG TPA: adenylate/guanylate cyclase domain-containing protein [Burkholderiales bacterium]|nr:AAA family ATPase [Betaproteobacteria bacterium]HQR52868.1 adenylate/guanylate cyclase domain-containing protein [Burkholderiales bacterium]